MLFVAVLDGGGVDGVSLGNDAEIVVAEYPRPFNDFIVFPVFNMFAVFVAVTTVGSTKVVFIVIVVVSAIDVDFY